MGILPDFSLSASDPSNPNATLMTPQQIAMQRALAAKLMEGGNDYSPVQSPWQGAARLAQALVGGYLGGQARSADNLNRANNQALLANWLNGGNTAGMNIPSTPGQTTPALAAADAATDRAQDAAPPSAAPGVSPLASSPMAAQSNAAPIGRGNSALASMLTGSGQSTPPTPNSSALASALNPSLAATGPTAGASAPVPPANIPNTRNGYAGPVSGPNVNTAGLNPAFADSIQDLQQDAQGAGIPNTMISGARSVQLQAQLYANYQARRAGQPLPFPAVGTGGLAAPPGSSYHNFGNAADIVTNNPAQQSELTAIASEPWRGIYPGANFGDNDHYQIAGPINSGSTGQPAPPPAGPAPGSLAAYAALKNAGQPTPVSAYAGATGQSPALAAINGANAPASPGATAATLPFASQALADALRGGSAVPGAAEPVIGSNLGPASIAPTMTNAPTAPGPAMPPSPPWTPPTPAPGSAPVETPPTGPLSPMTGAQGDLINTPAWPPGTTAGAPMDIRPPIAGGPPAPQSAPPAAVPPPAMRAQGAARAATAQGDSGQQPTPAPSVSAGMSGMPGPPRTAPSGIAASPAPPNAGSIDRQALLRYIADPYTPPGMQQVAMALLKGQQPSVIEGPVDPATGYPSRLLYSPSRGVLGRLNADGSVTPVGGAPPSGAPASGATPAIPPPPPGVDPAQWRKDMATRAATRASPSAAEQQEFSSKLLDRPSYKEYAASLPTANALPNLAKENSPAGDTALIDSVAKIINPGLAVRQGTYAIYQDEQGGLNQFKGEVDKVLHQNAVLQPETRAQFMRIASEKMQQYKAAWQSDVDQATRLAKANGLDPDLVIPKLPDLASMNLNDISSEHSQAYPVQRSGQTPPAAGARKAPDGNWYVADPARPGKYLQVTP